MFISSFLFIIESDGNSLAAGVTLYPNHYFLSYNHNRRYWSGMQDMKKGWMIRAGRGGRFANEFKDRSCVAIGWGDMGDLTICDARQPLRRLYFPLGQCQAAQQATPWACS